MKQEEKELLLKDLCSRLPYGIIADCVGERIKIKYVNPNSNMIYISNYTTATKWEAVEVIKPYLRPMSSMTEEEKEELSHLLPKDWSVEIDKLNNFYFDMSPSIFMEIDVFLNIINWLNSRHFDYRGLIPMGLALEATKDMYKI